MQVVNSHCVTHHHNSLSHKLKCYDRLAFSFVSFPLRHYNSTPLKMSLFITIIFFKKKRRKKKEKDNKLYIYKLGKRLQGKRRSQSKNFFWKKELKKKQICFRT